MGRYARVMGVYVVAQKGWEDVDRAMSHVIKRTFRTPSRGYSSRRGARGGGGASRRGARGGARLPLCMIS